METHLSKTVQLAREAGIKSGDIYKLTVGHMSIETLERFAELVRADEREQGQRWFDAVTAQHKQMILAEREACLNCYSPDDTATDWADKIRARGQA